MTSLTGTTISRKPWTWLLWAATASVLAPLAVATAPAPAPTVVANGWTFAWPTPDPRPLQGAPFEEWAQPTASGKPVSALFGGVRNGGRKFHEGLDIAPYLKRRSGEATDPIFAVYEGTVVHVSATAGNSSYGRYIVIEHRTADLPVATLYAHLASIDDGIRPGVAVATGQRIGIMGRSASGYYIPRSRAHLHLEVALMKTTDFQNWFDWKGFKNNQHGLWNGINLVGFDPQRLFDTLRTGRFPGFAAYVQSLPTAFRLHVATRRRPDFLERYPALEAPTTATGERVGWLIDFTWYGLPKRWRPLMASEVPPAKDGDIRLVEYDPAAFPPKCDRALIMTDEGPKGMATALRNDLQLYFGFR